MCRSLEGFKGLEISSGLLFFKHSPNCLVNNIVSYLWILENHCLLEG